MNIKAYIYLTIVVLTFIPYMYTMGIVLSINYFWVAIPLGLIVTLVEWLILDVIHSIYE